MSSKGLESSPGYRKLREELREAEIALRDQRERVAELRRRLPLDGVAQAYVFMEGPRDLGSGDAPLLEVRLSDLFQEPGLPLVLLHFMFGGAQTAPCPMCTLWADGYDGIVPHLERRMNFAIVVAGDLAAFRSHARSRGWRHARLLSSAGTSFKHDLEMEGEDGSQLPGVSVFVRHDDGSVRHFYTGSAMISPGQFRGMDLLSPFWNFLDLLPAGRESFMPRLRYED